MYRAEAGNVELCSLIHFVLCVIHGTKRLSVGIIAFQSPNDNIKKDGEV